MRGKKGEEREKSKGGEKEVGRLEERVVKEKRRGEEEEGSREEREGREKEGREEGVGMQ